MWQGADHLWGGGGAKSCTVVRYFYLCKATLKKMSVSCRPGGNI